MPTAILSPMMGPNKSPPWLGELAPGGRTALPSELDPWAACSSAADVGARAMLEASDTGDWSLSTAVTALEGWGVTCPAASALRVRLPAVPALPWLRYHPAERTGGFDPPARVCEQGTRLLGLQGTASHADGPSA